METMWPTTTCLGRYSRRHNLRTEPSLPPVVSILRREPPPCESTDDSFMKELKRRRRGFFTGRRSEDLSTAATTKSTRRSASTSAAAAGAAAVHSNSSLRQPAPPPTAVFGRQQIVRTPDTAFGTAAAVHGFSKATNPTEQRNATTQPTSNKRETPAPVNRTTSGDRMLNVTHKTDVAAQAAVKRVVCDERSSKDRNEYTPAGEPRDSTKRTLFSPPARNAACEADANATESHSVSEAQVRYVKQSEQNAKETGAQRGAVSVECGRDMPRACLHNAEESRDARPLPDEKDCVSLTGVAEFQEACSEADSALEIRTGLKQGRLNSGEEIIKADSKHEKTASDAITKPPDTEVLQSSSQYDMNDEDLDAAAMELSSPEDAASDSRAGVGSDEAVETCTSASSVKAPYIGCLASAPARTLEGEEAFKSTPGACAVQDDSVDGPIALPETKLPTFLSSTSNASHAPTNDRVEPKRSEQNTAATTHEANHGIAILMQPQAASSPMVQKHNFRQRASFKSDCGIQTQPPTPYPGTPHLPQQEKDHQLDGVRVATTDLQWTADVEKVLMLGNECCLMQHPPQRTAPESATRLDKTQYVLFHVEDHGHPSTSAEPRTVASSSCTLLGGDLAKDCPESTRDTVTRCHAPPSGKERRESEGASCEPATLKDLIVAQCPVVSSKDLITFHLSQASSVPPLRALCSQVLPSDEKCEEGTRQGVLAESEETLCSRTSFEHASVTGATPSETPCRRKVLNSRLPLGSLSTPVADDQPSTSSGAADVQLRRRGRSQSVGATTIPLSRPDQGRRLSNKAAAAEPAKGPIRFLGPLSSQNVVVLPESSVAICLPEGASRDDLWAPLSASSLRQSNTAGGSGLRHRHLLLASALEEPSFESVYNAILLPRLAAQEASVMPGDVPCRPTRSTSSSRAVSFDNSPTVVPLEPPPAPFAQCGVSQTTADAQPVLPPPFYRPRRRSSLCRSSSGSLLQEILEAADLCPASGSRRAFCRIPSILLEPDGARDATALTDNAGPETRSGSAPPIPEVRSPLISPFYSFEDTVSEHSSLPETVRFDSSRRCPALQKSEGEQRDGPAS
ncbi:hypothetical protein V5799_022694 [Amblyomma americanum]|uniref:Uncharacterized protein n=1 Tax=Amblyomma americanum TaxID=6943 RepID=A0AAQ4FK22_AMBAM